MHDCPCLFRIRTPEAEFPERAADAAVTDGNDPVAEQVAADRDFVPAVVVQLVAVRFERNRQEVEHTASVASDSRRYW